MFVDASAIVAFLSGEREAERIATALIEADGAITSPIAVMEAAIALARPDKLDRSYPDVERLIRAFLSEQEIEVRDLPPAAEALRLSTGAAHAFRRGRRGLNICDCFHYACAKYYDVAILATDDEFRMTDLETIR